MTGKGRKQIKNRISHLIRNLGLFILASLILPLMVYYGLRSLGFNPFNSLIIGAAPIVLFQLFQIIRKGKITLTGTLILFILAISIALTYISGDERFMLAKAGFFTLVISAFFFGSLLLKKPLVYLIAVFLLKRMQIQESHLDVLWEQQAGYRRTWKLSTGIWGCGILLNTVVIFLMAYTLPVDTVPILNTVVNLAIFVALQLVTNKLYIDRGIWKLVFQYGNPR